MHKLTAVSIFLVTALYGLVGPSSLLALGLALALVASWALPWRLRLAVAPQVVLSTILVGLMLTILGTTVSAVRGTMMQLSVGWAAVAGAMLLLATTRAWLAEAAGGDTLTLAIGLVALAACGGARTGAVFPSVVVLFLIVAFAARREADVGHAPLGAVARAQWPAILATLTVAGVMAGSVIEALPAAHDWAMQRIRRYAIPQSGFSDRLWLGSMRGMLMSDRKVMRVRGQADHLRGIVYTSYDGGRWTSGPEESMASVRPPREPASDSVEIEIVESEPRRYFLPLGAADVAVSTGIARVDDLGVVAPIAADPADRIWYRPSAEPSYAIAPPNAYDLVVPREVRRVTAPLGQAWTRDAASDAERLDLLMRRLDSDYAYALDFEHERHGDPVVDFLIREPRGHCEYFASAMALLARSLDIPARVVGGYRVFERNELGDHWVVRERNAHTWVEAWVDGSWRTFDPTPAGELQAAMTTPWPAAVIDLIGTGWAAFLSWLDKRTWAEMLSAPALLLLLPFALRWWRSRKRRGHPMAWRASDHALPCFDDLSAALANHGVVRSASETVEQLAARLDQTPLAEELAQRAATLLMRYAALRYGDLGDASVLERDVATLCAELGGSASA